MSMQRIATRFSGLFFLEAGATSDSRGSFERLYSNDGLEGAEASSIVQVSLARNPRSGTVRGLHFAVAPQSETKYVRPVAGALFDVVVDLRPGSPTAGKFLAITLQAGDGRTLCIPPGFAHGYQTLRDDTDVIYMMDRPYLAECAKVLQFDDAGLRVPWPQAPTAIAAHDLAGLDLAAALACVKGAGDSCVQYP